MISITVEMEILPQLPTTRRVVTGHNRGGKAIFEFDEALQPLSLTASKAAFESEGASRPVGFTLIHRTRGYPAKIQGSSEELAPDNLRRGQGEPGIVCEIVDLPPTSKQQAAFLHRNQSLDYGVVLKGSMQLILDDGVQKTLNEGDVYVQKWVARQAFISG